MKDLFFNQKLKLRFSFSKTAFFFIFIAIAGGCKEPEISNLGILPDSDKLGLISTDTASLITYTIPDDSIRSDETSLNLLGTYNDPVFGLARASIYTQLILPENNVTFGVPNDLVVDSVILSFIYNGYYGDTTPQTFKVYELSEDMYYDSGYYSTKKFNIIPGEIGSVNSIPNLTDSVPSGNIKEPPQLRISLNSATGDKLIKGTVDKYVDNTAFLAYFKGILVVPDTTSSPVQDDGAIVYFNLLNAYSKLTVYYRNVADTDTLKYDFIIREGTARLNHFSYSRTGTDIFSADTVLGNDLFYIQSMAGARAKIKIPFLENFVEMGKVVVNKAEMIINVEDNSTGSYAPHSNLFLTNIDSTGNATFLIDQFEENYGGSYDNSKQQYIFNITRHLQFLLTNYYEGKNYDYGLYLMAGGKAVNANRTILKGNKNVNGGIRLKISYTPL